METHTYPHLSRDISTVQIALFSNVSNAKELKERLLTTSALLGPDGDRERDIVNYAFIDAKLVTSRLQIQTATYQAILAHAQGSLRTKTIHSEILWVLNPNHNISEAIKRFGVSDTTTSLVVVRVSSPDFAQHDFEIGAKLVIKGVLTPLSSLNQFTDWSLVRKYYKLNADPAIQTLDDTLGGCQSEARSSLMDQIVVSCIAMKSVSA